MVPDIRSSLGRPFKDDLLQTGTVSTMEDPERVVGWIEYLGAQYRNSGILLGARHGRFDAIQGEIFCDALDDMEYPQGSAVPPEVVRQFVSRVWYIPFFLRRQSGFIARSGQDILRYRAFTTEVTRAVFRILAYPESRFDDDDDPESRKQALFNLNWTRGIRRADFPEVAVSVLDGRLAPVEFRLTTRDMRLVRYESASTFVAIRFRRHAERPAFAIGLVDDERRATFDVGDLLEAIVGQEEAGRVFGQVTGHGDMRDYLSRIADILATKCTPFLKGDFDTVHKVRSLYARRNRELADRVLACSQVMF